MGPAPMGFSGGLFERLRGAPGLHGHDEYTGHKARHVTGHRAVTNRANNPGGRRVFASAWPTRSENISMSEDTMNTRQTSYDRHGHRACHNHTPGLRQGLARLMDGGRWRGGLRRALGVAALLGPLAAGALIATAPPAHAAETNCSSITVSPDMFGDTIRFLQIDLVKSFEPTNKINNDKCAVGNWVPGDYSDSRINGYIPEGQGPGAYVFLPDEAPIDHIANGVKLFFYSSRGAFSKLTITALSCGAATASGTSGTVGQVTWNGTGTCSLRARARFNSIAIELAADLEHLSNGYQLTNARLTTLDPEIEVTGNSQDIQSGDNTPRTEDNTDYGQVVIGTSTLKTFKVSNTGSSSLSVRATINPVSPATARNFNINGSPSFVVPPNGSRDVTIDIRPDKAGVVRGTVSLATNDPDENPFTFTIQGTGVLPPTTTTITGVNPPSPTTVGQDYTVSVKVAPSGSATGTPSGTVTVSDGSGGRTCTATLNAQGEGSCTISGAPAGNYNLTAMYSGDSQFAGGTSAQRAHEVITKPTLAVSIDVQPQPVAVQQVATVTVTFTKPTGVRAAIDGTPAIRLTGAVAARLTANTCSTPTINRAATNNTATATCTFTPSTDGSGRVEVAYHGGNNYAAISTPVTEDFTVAPAKEDVELVLVQSAVDTTPLTSTSDDKHQAAVGFAHRAVVRVRVAGRNTAVTEGSVSITHVGGVSLGGRSLDCGKVSSISGVAVCFIDAGLITEAGTLVLKAAYNPGTAAFNPETEDLSLPVRAPTTLIEFWDTSQGQGGQQIIRASATAGAEFTVSVRVRLRVIIGQNTETRTVPRGAGSVSLSGGAITVGQGQGCAYVSGGIYLCRATAPTTGSSTQFIARFTGRNGRDINRDYLDSSTDARSPNGPPLTLTVNPAPKKDVALKFVRSATSTTDLNTGNTARQPTTGVDYDVFVYVDNATTAEARAGTMTLGGRPCNPPSGNEVAFTCPVPGSLITPAGGTLRQTASYTPGPGLNRPQEVTLTITIKPAVAKADVELKLVTNDTGVTELTRSSPEADKATVGFAHRAFVRVRVDKTTTAVTSGSVSITEIAGTSLGSTPINCGNVNSSGVATCDIPAARITKVGTLALKSTYTPAQGTNFNAAGPIDLSLPVNAATTFIEFVSTSATAAARGPFTVLVRVLMTNGSGQFDLPVPSTAGGVTLSGIGAGITNPRCAYQPDQVNPGQATGIYICTATAPNTAGDVQLTATFTGNNPNDYKGSSTDDKGSNGGALTLTVVDAPTITKIERQTPSDERTNAASITWRVTFDKAVTIGVRAFGVDNAVVANNTGLTYDNASTNSPPYTLDVTATTIDDREDEVGLTFDSDKISLASNPSIKLASATPTGVNEKYTVDRVRPTYKTSPDSVEAGNTITFTMTFDEPMQASRLPRITLDTTARAGGVKVGTVTHGGSNEFTAEITVPTGFGGSSITVTVDANGALDRAGNPAATGTQTAILTVTPAGTGATKPGQDPQLADPSIAVAVDYDLSTTVPDGSPPTLSNTNKRIAVIATVSGTSTVPMQQTDGTVTFTGLPTGATIVGRQNCNAVALAGTGTGGSFTATCTFTPIAGTLAGTYKVTAEFVPAVSTKFNSADDTVDVVLNAGQPTVSKAPQNNRLVLRADPPQGKNPPQREITFDDKTFGAPQAGAGGQLGKITFDVVDKNTGKPPQGKGPGPNNGWSDIPYNDTPQAAKALLRRGVYLVTMKITQSAPGGQTGQQGRAPAPAPAPQQQFTQDFTLQIVAPAGATVPAPTTGKGKIVVQLDTNGGGDGLQAHAFTATPGLGSLGTGFTLTTTKTRTSDTKDSGDLDPNTYTITAADFAGTDYSLSDIGCIVTGTVGSTTTPTASDRKVEVVLNANDIVTCVFSAAYAPKASVATVQKTRQMVADYLGDRNAMLLANGVNMDSRLSRLRPGGNGRSGQVGGTLSVNLGQSEDASASAFSMNLRTSLPGDVSITDDTITFAVSATRLARSGLFGADIYDDDDVVSGDTGDVGDGAVGPQMRWDVWIEGRLSRFDSGNSKDGTLGVVYLGADYLITPNMLIGLMTQYDWLGKDYDTNGRVKGHGWMVGPYAAARFGEALYLDVQARWGRSSNDITPLGTYTDTFKTTRWYVSGKLSGDFSYGDWTIRPGISVQYLSEKQKAYTDSQGNAIAGQTVSEGDVRVGPRLAYTYGLGDGGALVPWAEFEGVYTFGSKGKFSKGTYASDIHGLSGSVEAGFDWRLPAGAMFSLSGSYDGIGSGSKSYGARARIDIPF